MARPDGPREIGIAPPATTKLKNPPIVEAAIDIRAVVPADFKLPEVQRLGQVFKEEYPEVQELKKFEQTVKFNLSPSEKADPVTSVAAPFSLDSYRFLAVDRLSMATLRRDGMSFHRLAPYTSWEVISEQAAKFWREYRTLTRPQKIIRIGVRYINRVLIPFTADFDLFFTAPPKVPKGLPQIVSGFVTRLAVPVDESGTVAVVAHTLDPRTQQGYFSMLLDIDVSRSAEIDPYDDSGLAEILAGLRRIKNETFYGSITSRTVELFQG